MKKAESGCMGSTIDLRTDCQSSYEMGANDTLQDSESIYQHHQHQHRRHHLDRQQQQQQQQQQQRAPHGLDDGYYDLGDYRRPISSADVAATTWFHRGLLWCYGFNHEEAAKCFERAIAADPGCSMAYWGLAYALGPNYNKPWELFGSSERETTTERTHQAVKSARIHATCALPVEKALIEALEFRYPSAEVPHDPEFNIWNSSYADAMADVWARFPDDLDVACLYADAMMNLTPWKLWDLSTGGQAEGARTLEIRRVVERALAQPGGSRHAGLLHIYIHLMEMSETPEAALPSADKLRGLVPDSGHLNHMPSHIDVILGDYERSIQANTDAIKLDEIYLEREGPLNFYTLYRGHDYHFRLYSAMFSGKFAIAIETADALEATLSEELLRVQNPPMADWLESFFTMRIHVLVRFGRWRDVLAMKPYPDKDLYCVSTATLHYGRVIALAALGRVQEARQERGLFLEALGRVKPSRMLFKNKCSDILLVASAMLDGELEYREGDLDAAFTHLRLALERYDSLPFDEPWAWMSPARHALGALLLEQGRVEEALAVYSADLGMDDSLPRVRRHLNNVWSLHGYHECLVRLGRESAAELVRPQLQTALARADVPISSSCFCRMKVSRI